MTEEDLALYRRIISEKEARISELEQVIRNITYSDGPHTYVSFHDGVDLSEDHPIILEIHSN